MADETSEGLVAIWSTWPDAASARAAGRALVEARLAACAVVMPGLASIYRWNDAIEEADEVGLLIKTARGARDAAMAAIERDHPYDVPAVVALPVEAAGRAYGDWVLAETAPPA
ncbi:MAG: divalent-cation tolerance protein CutA [Hyphomicrobiales bacterium]|nr:divalent-cation tolerance protein CutA [Hyphomicrobiales bacterium]